MTPAKSNLKDKEVDEGLVVNLLLASVNSECFALTSQLGHSSSRSVRRRSLDLVNRDPIWIMEDKSKTTTNTDTEEAVQMSTDKSVEEVTKKLVRIDEEKNRTGEGTNVNIDTGISPKVTLRSRSSFESSNEHDEAIDVGREKSAASLSSCIVKPSNEAGSIVKAIESTPVSNEKKEQEKMTTIPFNCSVEDENAKRSHLIHSDLPANVTNEDVPRSVTFEKLGSIEEPLKERTSPVGPIEKREDMDKGNGPKAIGLSE